MDLLGRKGKHYTPEFPFSNLQNEDAKTQAWAWVWVPVQRKLRLWNGVGHLCVFGDWLEVEKSTAHPQ